MSGEEKIITSSVEKLSDSLFQPLKHRLSNSLTGSFFIAWVLINWQPILYFALSKDSVLKRFEYIELTYYSSFGENWWFYFILPLFIAAFYAFVFPFIEPGMEWATLFQREMTNNRNHKLLEKDLQNQKNLELLKAEIKEIGDLQTIIKIQKNDITQKSQTIEEKNDLIKKEIKSKNEISGQLEKCTTESIKSKTTIAELNQRLTFFQEEIKNKETQITDRDTIIVNLQKEIGSLGNDINNKDTQLIELKNDLENSLRAKELYNDELKALKLQLRDLENDLSKKNKDLIKKERSEVSMFNEIERLKSENDANKKIHEDLYVKTRPILDFEPQIFQLTNIMETITNRFPTLKRISFSEIYTLHQFLVKVLEFIIELNNSINSGFPFKGNFKLIVERDKTQSVESFINYIYPASSSWGCYIQKVNFIDEAHVEMIIYSRVELNILDFITVSNEYFNNKNYELTGNV